MKPLFASLIGAALFTTSLNAQTTVELKDETDKISYSIGMSIGTNLKKQDLGVKADLVAAGLREALSGGKTLVSEEEMQKILADFSKNMQAKQMDRMRELGEKSKKDGEAFLAENKKKEGIMTLPSGLQYKIVKSGTGKKPAATDTVTTHYRGTLIDGTEFDSSYKRNEPTTFPLGGVIAGWREAIQLMPVGSKWQLFIPANLAYGETGAGSDIPPNSTLIFDVELISIGEEK